MKFIVLIEDHGERTLDEASHLYIHEMDGDLVHYVPGGVVIVALPPEMLLNIYGRDGGETKTCGEWAAQTEKPAVLASTLWGEM